jgi:hypothetical protein
MATLSTTLLLLTLVSQAQGGIFDTLFGVVKTVVNNNGMIKVGDIVKNIAMTNMINLPNIPGVDIGTLLNGVGGLVGMKIFGGSTPARPPALLGPRVVRCRRPGDERCGRSRDSDRSRRIPESSVAERPGGEPAIDDEQLVHATSSCPTRAPTPTRPAAGSASS